MLYDSSTSRMSLRNMSWKHFSLVALTLQNSLHILVLRYSRIMPLVDGHRYFASTAIFLNELVKLTVSLTMTLYSIANDPKTPDTSTAAGLFSELIRATFAGDSWKLAIPAMLFTLQNSLHYVALSNLDAATFQVTDELKILSTAIFSVILLGRTLSSRKWLSLLLLMVGVAIVQMPHEPTHPHVLSVKDLKGGAAFHEARSIWELKRLGSGAARKLMKRSATYEGIDEDFEAANPEVNRLLGFVAVLLAATLSGLSGVYFEKVLKEPKPDRSASVWLRQVQLSFYSLWPALFLGVIFMDGEHIAKAGFFAGYNAVVWLSILLQATGGILVSFVINYANNITKNFATCISIVLSFLASVVFFDFEITLSYLVGTSIVLSAVYLYSNSVDDRPRPPQIHIPSPEEERKLESYFDLESVVAPARSPLRTNMEATTSSRPGTPSIERRGPKTPDIRTSKREF